MPPRISLSNPTRTTLQTSLHSFTPRLRTLQSITHARLIHIFRTVEPLREHRHELTLSSSPLAFVPTLGALHSGHLTLAREAAKSHPNVFLSIYLNPTQFGKGEDLDAYPQTFDSDLAQLEDLNRELESEGAVGRVTGVFAPTTSVIYPSGPPSSAAKAGGSTVSIEPIGSLLEGKSRPGFFRGVATVCMKLFNIVQADTVFFGQKDAQQCAVIRRMVKDFHLPCKVVVVPTVRDTDGLALSSRNAYLGRKRRKAAVTLPHALKFGEELYLEKGELSREELVRAISGFIVGRQKLWSSAGVYMQSDYVSVADWEDMSEIEKIDPKKGAVLSAAVKMMPIDESEGEAEEQGVDLGRVVRLIDNLILPPLK